MDARTVESERTKDTAEDSCNLVEGAASLFQIKNVHVWYFIKEKQMLKE